MKVIQFQRQSHRAQMERALEAEAKHWGEVIREAEKRLRAVHAAQDLFALDEERKRR